jgi:hypothetical protein
MTAKNIEEYVEQVMQFIEASPADKARIKRDLRTHLEERAEVEGLTFMLRSLESPEETAREFSDNLQESPSNRVLEELLSLRRDIREMTEPYYEYKSARTLFGLPLVHVKVRRQWRGYGNHNTKMSVAKGIIAIGEVSIGFLSIGAIALGGICIGGLSAGLLTFGGFALGLLLALGGVAVGTIAMGGVAVGLVALGGVAIAKIAIGGAAVGKVAISESPIGTYTHDVATQGKITWSIVKELVGQAYPTLAKWLFWR